MTSEKNLPARLFTSRDFLAGIVFILIGIAYAYGSFTSLRVGTANNMGPGYFPALLAGALVVVGLLVILKSLRGQLAPIGPVDGRSIILVALAPLAFAITLRGLGLAPSIFLSTMIAVYANREARLVSSLVIAAAVTALCAAIFLWGLNLPVRAFGSWLVG